MASRKSESRARLGGSYAPERPFDLVYDSGCLHSLVGGNAALYKDKLLGFLLPGGSFVLEHWGKRHALDWRPIGPRRRSQSTIERMFAPELQLTETEVTDFVAPLPFGPTVAASGTGFVVAVGNRWLGEI